jgi:hypothetical protein
MRRIISSIIVSAVMLSGIPAYAEGPGLNVRDIEFAKIPFTVGCVSGFIA